MFNVDGRSWAAFGDRTARACAIEFLGGETSTNLICSYPHFTSRKKDGLKNTFVKNDDVDN